MLFLVRKQGQMRILFVISSASVNVHLETIRLYRYMQRKTGDIEMDRALATLVTRAAVVALDNQNSFASPFQLTGRSDETEESSWL